ncbi:UPF0102 protein [Kitasatospora sp. NE20-6]|uniref:YraN family protein n=1 Tax=Kitasatospora sp. NE20-6 TaxID=2859066 RepID=UPI0034DBC7CC
MQSPNIGLGRYGEEVAARRLARDGLRILERNWRCAEGELDIVALDGDTVAVCEVKTRSERAFQKPTEGIDRTKAERLRRLAERWLIERWPSHFELLAQLVGSHPADAPPGGAPTDRGAARTLPGAGVPAAAPGVIGGGRPPEADGAAVPPPPGGVRIDLIAVVNRIKGAALVEHLRGAV